MKERVDYKSVTKFVANNYLGTLNEFTETIEEYISNEELSERDENVVAYFFAGVIFFPLQKHLDSDKIRITVEEFIKIIEKRGLNFFEQTLLVDSVMEIADTFPKPSNFLNRPLTHKPEVKVKANLYVAEFVKNYLVEESYKPTSFTYWFNNSNVGESF